jgi:hypothetical protein
MSGALSRQIAAGAHVTRRERRRAPRWAAPLLPQDLRVRVRAGNEAAVVNLSRLGILLDSTTRLLPGQRYTLHWSGRGDTGHASGLVVWAHVADVDGERGPIYRGALEFCSGDEGPWECVTRAGNEVPAQSGSWSEDRGTTFPRGQGGSCRTWRS